ncbi:hypothetical protein [Spirochaeta cellobiosiphila]|uniref:hypothetical protein n=1 Tax=Spirochaeta cellobiosiphila TaxID=504483 RepID=UPI00040975D6|nr:hypothetical protein [Spirochaeta cellobiosiphila]
MKRTLFFLFLVAIIGIPTFANNSDTIQVVMSSITKTNKKAMNTIKTEFRRNKYPYKVEFSRGVESADPSKYAAVVLLSTDSPDGVEPSMRDFLNKQSDKSPYILIALEKGTGRIFLDKQPAVAQQLGVDALSAATTYGPRKAVEMQHSWIAEVVNIVKGRS